MLYTLALIPVIGLMLFIYFNDKKEKEPFGFLIGLFFAGMGTIITALVLEAIGLFIVNSVFPVNTVINQLITAMFVVGPAEETGKFMVLRLMTWKNRNFNYSYDAIVYAVFVSLGFAALENISYVFSNGVGTALLRMVTAVPGHACFAVFMGFFFGKAKYAQITGKKKRYALFILLSMFVPIVLHGIYDAIIMGGGSTGDDLITGVSLILWISFVIALFVVSIILVIRSSRNDFCIVTLPGNIQTVYKPGILGSWTCSCGSVNRLNFCPKCGKQRPMTGTWNCPRCGTLCTFNFCGTCGSPKPLVQDPFLR